jgi:hypothetical protein
MKIRAIENLTLGHLEDVNWPCHPPPSSNEAVLYLPTRYITALSQAINVYLCTNMTFVY